MEWKLLGYAIMKVFSIVVIVSNAIGMFHSPRLIYNTFMFFLGMTLYVYWDYQLNKKTERKNGRKENQNNL